jgi:hypothetical protein
MRMKVAVLPGSVSRIAWKRRLGTSVMSVLLVKVDLVM